MSDFAKITSGSSGEQSGSTHSSALEFTYKRFLQCSLTSFNKDNYPTKIYLGKHNQKLLPSNWKHDSKKKLSECVVWVSDPSTIIYRLQNNEDINLELNLDDFKFIEKRHKTLQKEFFRIILLGAGFLGDNTTIKMNLSESDKLNDTIRNFISDYDRELNLNTMQELDSITVEQKLNIPEMFDSYKKLSQDPKKALNVIHNEIYPETVFRLAKSSAGRLDNLLDAMMDLWTTKDPEAQLKVLTSIVEYEMSWINRNYYLALKISENKSGVIPISVIKWIRLFRSIGKNLVDIIEAIKININLLKDEFFKQGFDLSTKYLKETIHHIENSLEEDGEPNDMVINLFRIEMLLKLYRYIDIDPKLQTLISDLNFLVSQIATLNKYVIYYDRLKIVQINSQVIERIQDLKKMIFISRFDKNFLNIPTKIQRTLAWKKETGKTDYEERESTVIDMYMPNNDTIVFQKPSIKTRIASIDLNNFKWPTMADYSEMIKGHGISLDESAKVMLYKNSVFEVIKTLTVAGSFISSNVDVNLITSTDPNTRKIQLEACNLCATYVNGQNMNKRTASGYLFSFRLKRKTIQSIFFNSLENFENILENSKRFFGNPNLDNFVQLEESIENTYNILSNAYSNIASISVSRGAVKLFIYFMSLRMYKISNNLKQSCEDLKRILYNKDLKDPSKLIDEIKKPFLESLIRLTNITIPIKNNQAQMDTTKEFTNLSFDELIDLFINLEEVQEDLRTIRKKRMDVVGKPLKQICSTELSNITSYTYYNYVHIESFCKAIIYLNKKNLFNRN